MKSQLKTGMLLCGGILGGSAAAQTEQPNILLVLSDDQSAFAVGCYGNGDIVTPNLDRFASEGVRFNRAYATSPQSVPSRASIMTGRSPVAVNMTRFNVTLARRFRAFPEYLREKGYYTGVAGRGYADEQQSDDSRNLEKPREGVAAGVFHEPLARSAVVRDAVEQQPDVADVAVEEHGIGGGEQQHKPLEEGVSGERPDGFAVECRHGSGGNGVAPEDFLGCGGPIERGGFGGQRIRHGGPGHEKRIGGQQRIGAERDRSQGIGTRLAERIADEGVCRRIVGRTRQRIGLRTVRRAGQGCAGGLRGQ